jgi:CheY-like chemotaxis protein
LSAIDILLVEDEALARDATERLLAQFGARVRVADSAAQAHVEYERKQPHVIIADIGMPDEDGYTLLGKIRGLERELGHGRVPAIALTAFARRQDRQHALAAGFDEHLAKPVDSARLVEVLARLVDGTAANQKD